MTREEAIQECLELIAHRLIDERYVMSEDAMRIILSIAVSSGVIIGLEKLQCQETSGR